MRWARVGLLAILVFDVWLRGHTFGPSIRDRWSVDLWPVTGAEAEPLDCDESAYAYMGRRIVRGDVLYRDLTENKPPLGYWLYTLAVAIGGARELTIRVLPVPLVLATIALVWWTALRLRGAVAACLAALIFAVASTDPYLFGNGANLEHALNLCSVASLALLIADCDAPDRRRLIAAGASLGAACLVKQVAVTHAPVFALALLMRRKPSPAQPSETLPLATPQGAATQGPVVAVAWRLRQESLRPGQGIDRRFGIRLVDVLVLACGFALIWGLAILILVMQDAGPSAFEDIVRYGSALATDTPPDSHAPPRWVRWVTGNADPTGKLPWPFGQTDYLVWWGSGTWPLWLAAAPALIWLLFGRDTTAARRLVAAWTLSACVQVALPGLFWPHYYLLPVPGLALVIAIFFVDGFVGARSAFNRSSSLKGLLWTGSTIALAAALFWTARIQARDYVLVAPDELTIRYKGGRQWVALRTMGRDLARRTADWADPRLFVWGWQSPLFIYSGLDGVSPHFFADPLLKAFANSDHPLIKPRIERIMTDLRARPPELIFTGDPPFPALKEFLSERYLPSQHWRGLWVHREKYGQFETFE